MTNRTSHINRTSYIVKSYITIALAMVLSSCHIGGWEPNYTTEEVAIHMEEVQRSAGFMEWEFSTDKEAYYLVAIQPAGEKMPQTAQEQKKFMTLALDSANIEYLSWRHERLEEDAFFIAEFASHTLKYGSVRLFFTGLKPDKEYWVYAFVVDPKTQSPCGKLYIQSVRTRVKSEIRVSFDYRVRGTWDYIYPMDTAGQVLGDFPYITATVPADSLGAQDVENYFKSRFEQLYASPNTTLHYGVDAQNNRIPWQEGKTYYTGIAGVDGGLNPDQYAVYSFVWHEDSTTIHLLTQ